MASMALMVATSMVSISPILTVTMATTILFVVVTLSHL
jgi:hypothetical protein